MGLKFNRKTEVTKRQYAELKKNASGIVAFREEDGKYFVKLLLCSERQIADMILQKYPPSPEEVQSGILQES